MRDLKYTNRNIQKLEVVENESNHVGHGLTEEERKVEKNLVRKVDFIIMPIILIVYLLNWIDRYCFFFSLSMDIWLISCIQEQLRLCAACWPRGRPKSNAATVPDRTIDSIRRVYPRPSTV